MNRLIGIVGKARSGKTTAANHLVSKYGYQIVSCAEPLKQLLIEALHACPPPAHVEKHGHFSWEDRIRHNRSDFSRWLMQFVGTDIGRALDPEIWIKRLRAKLFHVTGPVVIPDVRFVNEASLIKGLGGEIWRMVRLDGKGKVEHGADHASEREQESIIAAFTVEAHTGIERIQHIIDKYAPEQMPGPEMTATEVLRRKHPWRAPESKL